MRVGVAKVSRQEEATAATCEESGAPVPDGDRYCPSCGEGGEPASPVQYMGVSGQVWHPEDRLEGYWYAVVWLSVLVPFIGGWAILILTTVLHSRWRYRCPAKARKLNVQGWLAFLASLALTFSYLLFTYGEPAG
jgi:hypothetical protein